MSSNFIMFYIILTVAGMFCLTAVNTALRTLQKKEKQKKQKKAVNLFFYRKMHQLVFHNDDLEELFFVNTFAQNILRFIYGILVAVFIYTLNGGADSWLILNWVTSFIYLFFFFLLYFLVGDYLPRIVGAHLSQFTMNILSVPASLFMLLMLPFSVLFLKFSRLFNKSVYYNPLFQSSSEAKQELIEMIEEAKLSTHLDPHDKKLIESVMAFKDRIAREVMVPRVDVFSLDHQVTIEEAAVFLLSEGYTRTPVYKNTLDNIIGVLMYKDLLAKYMEFAQVGDRTILQAPIATLIKSILYIPETKKISHLLQEFRKKQVHLAIIVDEYGGTEGIVTIEDILEVIVGNIADEYDIEENLYVPLADGSWLVDARMGIWDIEEQIGIQIPQDGDYDTIGGYIFHETGMIPAKGFILENPEFELEVIRSNDRRVEKLRIKPIITNLPQE